jgi:uncharacterized integral membrane protein
MGKLAKIIRLVCSFLMAVLIISFAVSNREHITVALEPLPYQSEMPLYLFGLIAVLLGFLWGSSHSLAERFTKHLQLKEHQRTIEALRAEVISLRAEQATKNITALPHDSH